MREDAEFVCSLQRQAIVYMILSYLIVLDAKPSEKLLY